MKKLLLAASVFCLLHGMGFAQQDPQSSMYFFNPMFYNPGYAGSRGSVNLTAIHRSQWAGIEGAPMTQFLSFHMPFQRQNMGIGLNVSHDRIGSRVNTAIYANYAYHIRLNKKEDKIALGIKGGIDLYQYDFSDLNVTDPTDPNYYTSFSQALPNFGLGAYFYGKRYYVGVSVPRLLEPGINSFTASTALLQRHYFFMAGYAFKINSVIDLKPSVFVKVVENAPMTIDANLSLYLFQRFWIGGIYRFHESAGVNFCYQHKDIFSIGYAFDYPFNDMRFNNFGSHEIMLAFDFRTKKRAYLSPRYF